MVADDSRSAELVRESLKARSTAGTCQLISGLSVVAFGALLFGSFSSSSNKSLYTAGFVGTGVSAAGFGIAGYFYTESASNRAVDAYSNYDEGLQKRLGVCANNACEDPPIVDATERKGQ